MGIFQSFAIEPPATTQARLEGSAESFPRSLMLRNFRSERWSRNRGPIFDDAQRKIPLRFLPTDHTATQLHTVADFLLHDRANNRRRLVERGHTLCSRAGAGFGD
jgi:hypothetical protein